MLALVGALIGSYLIGSIPTAYLVVRWLKRIDVRDVGSGNVGATNVTRVAGLRAGVVVFLIDLAKGLLAVVGLAPWLLAPVTPAAQLGCGLASVLGHTFPVWLQFRGGKGVATTIGVLIGSSPTVAGLYLAVWGLCVGIWRYVSVGSLAAAAMLPIAQMLTHRTLPEILLGASLALLITVQHRSNIQRLVAGREHRIGRQRMGTGS